MGEVVIFSIDVLVDKAIVVGKANRFGKCCFQKYVNKYCAKP